MRLGVEKEESNKDHSGKSPSGFGIAMPGELINK